MVTAKQMYILACNELKTGGKNTTQTSEFEAALLCEKFFDVKKEKLFIEDVFVKDTDCESFKSALKKRKSGYPLQYILGEWEFYGRDFLVGEGVLIPRADTETLIEATLSYAKNATKRAEHTCEKSLRILDLCSGTGCIAITLAKEILNSQVFAIEKSEEAFFYLQKNIEKHSANVQAIKADALVYEFSKFEEFDIIVSNPPYLTNEDMQTLQCEVSYEPQMALDGSINFNNFNADKEDEFEDGTFFYHMLTNHWSRYIKKGGLLAYEIGIGQEKTLKKIFQNNCSFSYCEYKDLCGIIRVTVGIKEE